MSHISQLYIKIEPRIGDTYSEPVAYTSDIAMLNGQRVPFVYFTNSTKFTANDIQNFLKNNRITDVKEIFFKRARFEDFMETLPTNNNRNVTQNEIIVNNIATVKNALFQPKTKLNLNGSVYSIENVKWRNNAYKQGNSQTLQTPSTYNRYSHYPSGYHPSYQPSYQPSYHQPSYQRGYYQRGGVSSYSIELQVKLTSSQQSSSTNPGCNSVRDTIKQKFADLMYKGPQGERGPRGPQGPPGQDGGGLTEDEKNMLSQILQTQQTISSDISEINTKLSSQQTISSEINAKLSSQQQQPAQQQAAQQQPAQTSFLPKSNLMSRMPYPSLFSSSSSPTPPPQTPTPPTPPPTTQPLTESQPPTESQIESQPPTESQLLKPSKFFSSFFNKKTEPGILKEPIASQVSLLDTYLTYLEKRKQMISSGVQSGGIGRLITDKQLDSEIATIKAAKNDILNNHVDIKKYKNLVTEAYENMVYATYNILQQRIINRADPYNFNEDDETIKKIENNPYNVDDIVTIFQKILSEDSNITPATQQAKKALLPQFGKVPKYIADATNEQKLGLLTAFISYLNDRTETDPEIPTLTSAKNDILSHNLQKAYIDRYKSLFIDVYKRFVTSIRSLLLEYSLGLNKTPASQSENIGKINSFIQQITDDPNDVDIVSIYKQLSQNNLITTMLEYVKNKTPNNPVVDLLANQNSSAPSLKEKASSFFSGFFSKLQNTGTQQSGVEVSSPTASQPTASQPTASQPTAMQPTAMQPTAMQPTQTTQGQVQPGARALNAARALQQKAATSLLSRTKSNVKSNPPGAEIGDDQLGGNKHKNKTHKKNKNRKTKKLYKKLRKLVKTHYLS